MEKISRWLTQPYPIDESRDLIWRDSFVAMAFVTLFLFIFRPFGISAAPVSTGFLFQICIEYGLVTFAVSVFWGYFFRLFPSFFNESKWVIWKEILFTLLFISTIALANMVYTNLRLGTGFGPGDYLQWLWVTLAVGIFPTFLGIYSKQLKLQKQFSSEAANLSASLAAHPHTAAEAGFSPKKIISLIGDNLNESLDLEPENLFFIEAADNYVQVYFSENGSLRNRLLRGSLKKMEESLAGEDQFFRCHRAFLVNLEKVHRVSGNAQGYKLHLIGVEVAVPVSRALNGEVQQRFSEKN